MADDDGFEGAMRPHDSGTRNVRWRVLLAHDANAQTCDQLVETIAGALGNVDVFDVSSIQGGAAALHPHRRQNEMVDVCFVCLDLPPAPNAGARLAELALEAEVPVVLVTRSQRWIPQQAPALRDLPWVKPDATPAEVSIAVTDAMASQGRSATWSVDDLEDRTGIRDSVA